MPAREKHQDRVILMIYLDEVVISHQQEWVQQLHKVTRRIGGMPKVHIVIYINEGQKVRDIEIISRAWREVEEEWDSWA